MVSRILARLRPLVGPWAIAAWGGFIWAWSVLAEVHLAEFVYRLGRDMSDVVHSHPWIVLVVTIIFLVLVAIWPEIKHLIPKLPKNVHERIHELDWRCTEMARLQSEINDAHGTLHAGLQEWVSKLADDRTKAIGERSDLSSRISRIEKHKLADLELSLNKLEEYVATHVVRLPKAIEDLDRRMDLGGSSISSVLAGLGKRMLCQSELTELLDDNRSCRQEYMDLRAIYPDHPAASKPFARGWRPSLPGQETDEATRRYEQWAKHMEFHMNRLQGFSEEWDTYQAKPEIYSWVKYWAVNSREEDGQLVFSAIADVMRDLMNLLERYAADLEREVGKASATIS
jgi:hypothetical protein